MKPGQLLGRITIGAFGNGVGATYTIRFTAVQVVPRGAQTRVNWMRGVERERGSPCGNHGEPTNALASGRQYNLRGWAR
jgi:hypothetical protein